MKLIPNLCPEYAYDSCYKEATHTLPEQFIAYKCKEPKFEPKGNLVWERRDTIVINDQKVVLFRRHNLNADAFGEYVYFVFENQWYKIRWNTHPKAKRSENELSFGECVKTVIANFIVR